MVALRSEAEFYGITSLVQKLDIVNDRPACGGLLLHARLTCPGGSDAPVVAVACSHHVLAVAHRNLVTCWAFSEPCGWEILAESPIFDRDIERLAVNAKLGHRGENMVAVSCSNEIRLWEFKVDTGTASNQIFTFDLSVTVDAIFFIGNQLVATSHTGKVGIRHAMTQVGFCGYVGISKSVLEQHSDQPLR